MGKRNTRKGEGTVPPKKKQKHSKKQVRPLPTVRPKRGLQNGTEADKTVPPQLPGRKRGAKRDQNPNSTDAPAHPSRDVTHLFSSSAQREDPPAAMSRRSPRRSPPAKSTQRQLTSYDESPARGDGKDCASSTEDVDDDGDGDEEDHGEESGQEDDDGDEEDVDNPENRAADGGGSGTDDNASASGGEEGARGGEQGTSASDAEPTLKNDSSTTRLRITKAGEDKYWMENTRKMVKNCAPSPGKKFILYVPILPPFSFPPLLQLPLLLHPLIFPSLPPTTPPPSPHFPIPSLPPHPLGTCQFHRHMWAHSK
jgi:hypothetical protein